VIEAPKASGAQNRLRVACAAGCLFSAAAFVAHASAEELPARKPGHWRLTTISDSIGMKMFDTCLSAADAVLPGIGDKACGKPDMKRLGDELYVTIVCTTDEGKETRSTVLTGDFSTWYRAMSKITFTPPQGGLPQMGVTVDGTFIGPSCDDLRASAGRTEK
jgi:hypothetical protein